MDCSVAGQCRFIAQRVNYRKSHVRWARSLCLELNILEYIKCGINDSCTRIHNNNWSIRAILWQNPRTNTYGIKVSWYRSILCIWYLYVEVWVEVIRRYSKTQWFVRLHNATCTIQMIDLTTPCCMNGLIVVENFNIFPIICNYHMIISYFDLHTKVDVTTL